MSEPSWSGDEAEQRAFVLKHYGQRGLEEFLRGGTMALDAYERGKRDAIGDNEGRAY